jgi:hypothetical protein
MKQRNGEVSMNKLGFRILAVLWLGLCGLTTQAETYDCLDIVVCGDATDGTPDWVLSARSEGDIWLEQDGSWILETSRLDNHSRIVLSLDRDKLQGDIGLSLICDGDDNADVALQLLDDLNKVVVVDLVGNAIPVKGHKPLRTFAIPLRKHPSATRIAIQQVSGKVAVRGIVLFSLLIGDDSETDIAAQIEMLTLLQQQLSPKSQTWRKIEQIMAERGAAQSQTQSKDKGPSVPKSKLSGAELPEHGNTKVAPSPQVSPRFYFDFANETFCEVRMGDDIKDVIRTYGTNSFPTYAGEVIAERPYAGSYRSRYDYRYRVGDTVIHTIHGKVANLFSWSNDLHTDKGLTKGDSRERLIQLYGQPDGSFNSDKALNYYFDGIRAVVFLTEADTISHIEILRTVEDTKTPATD